MAMIEIWNSFANMHKKDQKLVINSCQPHQHSNIDHNILFIRFVLLPTQFSFFAREIEHEKEAKMKKESVSQSKRKISE